jgi:uncharacterized protein YlxW (UPF0749 family)
MFKLFTRTRQADMFKVRSPERDRRADAARLGSIVASIDSVMQSSQAEREGLERRLNDVLARAALTGGNDTDEYLDRELANMRLQHGFDLEIANGERRLRDLGTSRV